MTENSLDYNRRLFEESRLRRALHNSRFEWFRRTVGKFYGDKSISCIELGCFDGRLLDYFPVAASHYQGFDAGWEGGLLAAQQKYKGRSDRTFTRAVEPVDLAVVPDRSCDIAVALETLEHVPESLVDGYLEQLARIATGHLFVTVPNEIGAVFLVKFLAKKAIFGSSQPYSPEEVLWATLAKMDKVERNEHKGFDYRRLITAIDKHFEVVQVRGLPFGVPAVSLTISIVAKRKNKSK